MTTNRSLRVWIGGAALMLAVAGWIACGAGVVRAKPPKPSGGQSLIARTTKTDLIGNPQAGKVAFDNHADGTSVRYFGVRWDGDKIRGIRWEYFDTSKPAQQVGGYDDSSYTLTSYTFQQGETLKTCTLKDSGYGHGSLRRIEFTTSTGGKFTAGPDGFDHEKSLTVTGCLLQGVYGKRNVDNFINSAGLWVSLPIKSIVASSIDYDFKHMTQGEPEKPSMDLVTGVNKSSTTQTMKTTTAFTYSDKADWTSSWGVKAGVKCTITAGIPKILGAKFEASAETSYTSTSGGSTSQTIQHSYSPSIKVPPGKTVKCHVFCVQRKVTIPYTCSMTMEYMDGTKQTLSAYKGSFDGTASSDVQVKWK